VYSRDSIAGSHSQEKKSCPEYELAHSPIELEALWHAEKSVIAQKLISSETNIGETTGVVIAAVVTVAQRVLQL
jgi:hypothetical protein